MDILICKCGCCCFYKTFTSDWINEDPFVVRLSHQKVYWLNDGEVLVNMLWVVGGPVTLEAHQQQVGSELAHPDILKHQNEQDPVHHVHPLRQLHHSLHPIFWSLRNKNKFKWTLSIATTLPFSTPQFLQPQMNKAFKQALLQITSLGGKGHIWKQKPAAGHLRNSDKVLLIACTLVACYSQWVTSFLQHVLNSHQSGVLIALFRLSHGWWWQLIGKVLQSTADELQSN